LARWLTAVLLQADIVPLTPLWSNLGSSFSNIGEQMNVNIDVAATRRKNAELSRGAANSAIYNAVLKALAESGACGRALDFGAGTGTLTRMLESSGLFSEIHAVDLLDWVGEEGGKTCWHRADLNLPTEFKSAWFDTIVSSEVIEHLENPRAVAREWARLLRPGGSLVFSTPNNESWRSIMSLIARGHFVAFTGTSYPAHITALTRIDLVRIVEETGFGLVTVNFSDHGLVPKLTYLNWQSLSFGLLCGVRWSDNVVIVAKKE
jgi:2-polyprenyl-3-methyl-5-hydroxy-6-metoxy-1,4-benzoquinol methylase